MKRLISIIFTLAILFCAASAYAEVVGGNCSISGDVKWSFDTETGVLTISGEGKTSDYGGGDYAGSGYIRYIAPWCKYNDDIKTVIISEGVTYLGRETLIGSGIENIIAADSLVKVSSAFGLKMDTPFALNPDNWYCGGLYIGRNLVKANHDLINDTLIVREGTVSISDSINFRNELLRKVILPEGLEFIGASAFAGCKNLAEINFPKSIKTINYSSFSGCESLTNVDFQYGLEHIGSNAFSDCINLGEIKLPENFADFEYNSFDNTAFYNNEENWHEGVLILNNCILDSNDSVPAEYTVPTNVTHIFEFGFYGNKNLQKIIIPSNVKSIGRYAFGDSPNLREATLPDGLTEIVECAFNGCSSLTSVTLPSSVTVIGGYAFAACSSLNSITLPDGLTRIEYGAFLSSGLKSLHIPSHVEPLGISAFDKCYLLENITVAPDNPNFIDDNGALYTGDGSKLILYPIGSSSEYFAVREGTESVSASFERAFGLKKIYIPASVKYMSGTLGYDYWRYPSTRIIICGEPGSYAETYAAYYYLVFETTGETL